MKTESKSAYSRDIIRQIKAAAKKQFPNCVSVRHIFPRAYCVAKPATGCAVFAIPAMDAEPQLKLLPSYPLCSSSEVIHGESVYGVNVGEWVSLAYLTTQNSGGTQVINL